MKLLVFAHTPPPHHGQSYMVQLELEGFGGDQRQNRRGSAPDSSLGIECYHVDARVSRNVQEIGGFQIRKLALLLGYCFQALWLRFRHGVVNFYYVPAPSKPAALYRDWLVMVLCRPFFKNIIFHWHAAGLANWLESSVSGFVRRLSFWLLGHASLSIVLSEYNRADAEKLHARRVRVVRNGIPDPCPDFDQTLLPLRRARFAARQKLWGHSELTSEQLEAAGGDPHLVKVLFLGLCSHQKGLFDSLEALALANNNLAKSNSPLRFCLAVGGEFPNASERAEFESRISKPDLQLPETHCRPGSALSNLRPAVKYLGFVSGTQKSQAFAESDCFCFPSYYEAESFGLVLIEAMAFGLPILATRWRSFPELFPPGYKGLVEVRSPDQLAQAMQTVILEQTGEDLRKTFLSSFTLQQYLSHLADALRSADPASNAVPSPFGRG